MDMMVAAIFLLATAGSTTAADCAKLDRGCIGRADGDYPVCYPLCKIGLFATCLNQVFYERQCVSGLVFDPITKSCQYSAAYCPMAHNKLQRRNALFIGSERSVDCVSTNNSCYRLKDGDYALCSPLCEAGSYITCVNRADQLRQCPSNLVYNPDTNACDYSVPYCPRKLPEPAASISDNRVGSLHKEISCCLIVLSSIATIVLSIYCCNKL